eukprot:GFYU01019742.1.p1 GENE.GFYU01019742.1~~GFYU01019742.1.p1  ORF type:complete len:247 (-),score=68.24 GFYU01019742.1:49-732(-)
MLFNKLRPTSSIYSGLQQTWRCYSGQVTRPLQSEAAAATAEATQATAAGGAGGNVEQRYAKSLRWLHWIIGGGTLFCFGTVQAAQRTKGETKGNLMSAHKSMGLLLGMVVPARIAIRLSTKIPPHLPGAKWEQMAGSASHGLLYAAMVVMPASGIAMGYFGGKGLPFFGAHIPGSSTPNGAIAKNAFKIHKNAGQAFEYFTPIHIGAAGYHAAKGQAIFTRVNPFAP